MLMMKHINVKRHTLLKEKTPLWVARTILGTYNVLMMNIRMSTEYF